MATAFRAFLRIGGENNQEIEDHFWEQYRDWLVNSPSKEPRHLDISLIQANAVTNFDKGCSLVYGEVNFPDGSRAIRTTLNEDKPSGRWVTAVTLFLPTDPDQSACLLFDGDSPYRLSQDAPTRTEDFSNPQLLISLMEVLQFHDGSLKSLPLMRNARRIKMEDLPSLRESLFDPDRQGPIFLARYPSRIRNRDTLSVLDELTRYATATGSVYLVGEDVALELDKTLGPFHAIPRNSMRTFLPEMELDSATDGRAHKTLALGSVASGELSGIQKRLGDVARNTTLYAALPDWFSEVTTVMDDHELRLLTDGARSNAASVNESALEKAMASSIGTAQSEDAAAREDLSPRVSAWKQPATNTQTNSSVEAHLTSSDGERFETIAANTPQAEKSTTIDSLGSQNSVIELLRGEIEELTSRVKEAKRVCEDVTQRLAEALQSKEELAKQLKTQAEKVASVTADLKEVRRDRDTSILEAADLYSTNRDLQETDRIRRGQLIKHGLVAEAEVERIFATPAIESFGEIAQMLEEDRIDGVEFTGDLNELRDLDSGTLGEQATRAYDVLVVLSDYVQQRKNGFAGDLKMYLEDDSHIGRKIPVSALKRGESSSTYNSRRKREARIYRVPATVDSSRQAYMEAHLKLGYRGRLHFYDDTASHLRPVIYVGYIGYHLPTKDS